MRGNLFRVSPWDGEGWNGRTNVKKIPQKSEGYKMLKASQQGKPYVTHHQADRVAKKVLFFDIFYTNLRKAFATFGFLGI